MKTDHQAAAPPASHADTPPPPADDASLVLAALRDPLAFAPLYHAHRDRVFWYLLARTGNEEDAADLTQHTFLRALDSLVQYRADKGPFVAWLFGIARNAATNFRRRTRPTVAWEVAGGHAAAQAAPSTEESVIRLESLAALIGLLTTLEPAKQELLALRFVAGLTSAEIAAITGKSEAATKKHLTRIVQSLKEHSRELGE